MTTLEYAMQMERDGEYFYRKLANKCQQPAIAKILQDLADMEKRHFAFLNAMKAKTRLVWSETFRDGIKTIFAVLDEKSDSFDVDVSEIEIYKEAQELEKRSHDFYLAKSRRVNSPTEKRFLQRLAEEENEHWQMLQRIIDFLEEPKDGHWLENAEWHHQDTY